MLENKGRNNIKPIRTKEKQLKTYICLLVLLLFGIFFFIISEKVSNPFHQIVLRDVGFVLAPVSMLTLIFQYFIEEAYINKIIDEIREQIFSENKPRFCTHESSIVNVHPNRSSVNLQDFFKGAEHNIDILTPNLNKLNEFAHIIIKKANAGVTVRILALDPKSLFVNIRYKELNYEKKRDFETQLASAIEQFEQESYIDLTREAKYELKKFNRLPTIVLFRADNRLILNFILSTGSGCKQPHIEFDLSLEGKNSVGNRFLDHFNKIWNKPNIDN